MIHFSVRKQKKPSNASQLRMATCLQFTINLKTNLLCIYMKKVFLHYSLCLYDENVA